MTKNIFENNLECNHDLNDEQNTLVKLKKRKRLEPDTIMCAWKKCKKGFKLIKKKKEGGYALVDKQ